MAERNTGKYKEIQGDTRKLNPRKLQRAVVPWGLSSRLDKKDQITIAEFHFRAIEMHSLYLIPLNSVGLG